MYYNFICVAALVILINPFKAHLSGRFVAAFTLLSAIIFSLSAARNGFSRGFGSIYIFVNTDLSANTAQGVTAFCFLLLSIYCSFSYRNLLATSWEVSKAIRIPDTFILTMITCVTLSGCYLLAQLGIANLMSYDGYGSIKDLNERFEFNELGKVIGGTFRPIALVLIASTIVSARSRRWYLQLLAAVPISIAFMMSIAEASRITSVYLIVAAVSFYVIDRKKVAAACALISLIFVGYALEARAHPTLGLSYVYQYITLSFSNPDLLEMIVTNLAASLLVTSASAKAAVPEAYDVYYKFVSFAPSFGFIDGFQSLKLANEQRIAEYIPFNAFGEAWVFGPFYYTYLWIVIFFSASAVNSSLRIGRVAFVTLLGAFVIGLMFASQYPIRNSVRYFYGLILLRYVLGRFFRSTYGKGFQVEKFDAKSSGQLK
ncbi:hypothetical protein QO002_004624 [Pararhizobium capsulatum DSM 1112]|uniref:Oligosaccharide repeat unit polymerase n=1 Tax=Pararhizobium capsulatum DSM 1112 TaxID=1121113 RepID=A0ABU0BWT5_9HYPH|nr:hypothetical protein [Pararhizobium capsulatum]MDQ0322418.1 hypothetical protein [Pararhizobium capsulatum DSM 1112]